MTFIWDAREADLTGGTMKSELDLQMSTLWRQNSLLHKIAYTILR